LPHIVAHPLVEDGAKKWSLYLGDYYFGEKKYSIEDYHNKMIPYMATLIVLAFSSKSSQAPRAEGIPYDKGSR